ncbi:hypothetical protein FRUB_09853 [Fimbriiglobus ruber]|uniref:Uncharacterized protein n=2 Tax=Fimbriiglobus ruber TaxID=1908690 RepID=A0A225D095_9BACT|nr:hypothetical protein FRUB_09853 [Fimbriiglobus ruber]
MAERDRPKPRRADDDDDDDDRPRKRRRPVDDDEEEDDRPRGGNRAGDDPPRRKTRNGNRDDDDGDDAPRRPKRAKKKGVPVLLIVGIGVGALVLLSCCGVGGYFAFFSSFSPVGKAVVITEAKNETPPFGGGIMVSIKYQVSAAGEPGVTYVAKVKAGNKTSTSKTIMVLMPGASGTASWSVNDLAKETGPLEVWVESEGGSSPGKKVSNVFVIP